MGTSLIDNSTALIISPRDARAWYEDRPTSIGRQDSFLNRMGHNWEGLSGFLYSRHLLTLDALLSVDRRWNYSISYREVAVTAAITSCRTFEHNPHGNHDCVRKNAGRYKRFRNFLLAMRKRERLISYLTPDELLASSFAAFPTGFHSTLLSAKKESQLFLFVLIGLKGFI